MDFKSIPKWKLKCSCLLYFPWCDFMPVEDCFYFTCTHTAIILILKCFTVWLENADSTVGYECHKSLEVWRGWGGGGNENYCAVQILYWRGLGGGGMGWQHEVCSSVVTLCQKCRWQVTSKHGDIPSSTQRSQSGLAMLSRLSVGTCQGSESTCNWPGNIRPQLSQLAELLWTDPGVKSGINVQELISFKKKKKVQVGNETLSLPP